MITFLTFIFYFFLAMIILGFIARLMFRFWLKRMFRRMNPNNENTDNSAPNQNYKSKNKLIDKNEGDYVDFEEVD